MKKGDRIKGVMGFWGEILLIYQDAIRSGRNEYIPITKIIVRTDDGKTEHIDPRYIVELEEKEKSQRYFHISYMFTIKPGDQVYSQEMIDVTPLEYVLMWKEIGRDYSDRVILHSTEITEEEYNLHKDKFGD